MGAVALAGAVAIGIVGAVDVSLGLLPFVAVGAFIVVAYNLELFGGRFHSDFWFAAAWGAFPALTGYWINALGLRPQGILVAAGCFMLSVAQRRLSTPVRELRRHTVSVSGRQRLADGSTPQAGTSRALDGKAQRLHAHETLRGGDEGPERAHVQRRSAVDRGDADLAHQRRPVLGGLRPVGEQHAHRSRHPPGQELLG